MILTIIITVDLQKGEPMNDLINRQAAIDAVDSETVSTNPKHFRSSEKFNKFMDDADIASFGKWKWAKGFNTALVATTTQLEKLPSAQPDLTKLAQELWAKTCLITDNEGMQHQVIHTTDLKMVIEEVTGWMI